MPSGRRHYRITLADALSAHERALQTGGRQGINIDLVESAIGRPYVGYYRPIAGKAAALLHSVATNHGFTDGNKRTAVILTYLLVERSGYSIIAIEGEDLNDSMEAMILAVVNRELAFEAITGWFRARIEKKED